MSKVRSTKILNESISRSKFVAYRASELFLLWESIVVFLLLLSLENNVRSFYAILIKHK